VSRSDCVVSVIAPLSNDEEIVESFVRETAAVLKEHYAHYELVLVDDGSTDGTVARVTALLGEIDCIRLIRCSRSFGIEVAISAGLDSVIGDFVVVMLPDSDPPSLVPRMVELSRSDSGTVVGVRIRRADEPLWSRCGARLFYAYCNKRLRLNVTENSTYFRVLSRQAVNAIIQIKDRMRFLRIFSADVGFPIVPFPYEPISRRAVRRPRRLIDAVSLGVGIIVSNSTHPLRLVSWLGLVLSGLNLAYIVYVLLVYLFKKKVAEGWATLSLQNAVMFFCLFLFFTVLCEYVARVIGELRTRPLYHTLEERNSSVAITDESCRNVTTESADPIAPKSETRK
jgi:dolichol-phosphate mannosyltransferase